MSNWPINTKSEGRLRASGRQPFAKANEATGKQGWRTIGGIKKYYRSKWEANYARYLQWLKENSHILDWKHEPTTFWFKDIKRGVRSYLPDFSITETSGTIVYHEVKGWMDAKSATKIKRMAKYHPDIKLIVIQKASYLDIKQKVSRMIQGWEK